MYLGIKFKIVKSYARIHKDNLVNFGIVPLLFEDPTDYDKIKAGDHLAIANIRKAIIEGATQIKVKNLTQGYEFNVTHNLSEQERKIIAAGGKLNYIKTL